MATLQEHAERSLKLAAELSAETGLPAHNALGSPLVRCACGTVHYCTPTDSDRTGRTCSACTVLPDQCACWQLSCGSCGPRMPERPARYVSKAVQPRW